MLQDIIQRIKNWFRSGSEQDETSEVRPLLPPLGGYSALDSYLRIRKDRLTQFQDYRLMDAQSPEISHALNIYADNAVNGDGDGDTYRVEITAGGSPKVEEAIREIEESTGIKERLWGIARALVQNGEVFQEPLISKFSTGKYGGLVALKNLPPHTMWLNLDDYGKVVDPEKHFIQRIETDQEVAAWPEGQVIHFKIEADLDSPYGRSILYPARRIFRQLHIIDDALVIARARRANMRYVYKFELGAMDADARIAYLDKIKKRHTTRRFVDPTSGTIRTEEQPLRVEDDIYLSSKDEVDAIQGDSNIANIADVEHLYNKMFTAIGVPKSFLNREQDINAKATLTELRIQFARNVRRIQSALRAGLRKFYQIGLISKGFTDDQVSKVKFDILFPAVTAIDELIYWQTMESKARVAVIFRDELQLFDDDYIYSKIFSLTAEEIDDIRERLSKQEPRPPRPALELPTGLAIPRMPRLEAVDTSKAAGPFDASEIVETLRDNPEAMDLLNDLKALVDLNLDKALTTTRSPKRRKPKGR